MTALGDLLGEALDDEPWRERALCAQVDIGDLFFPEKGGSTVEAKAVCRLCPVRNDCLRYALDNGEKFGIWGGLSEQERSRLARNAKPRPSPAAERRLLVAAMLARGWAAPAIAQYLGVAVHLVWHDAWLLRQEAS